MIIGTAGHVDHGKTTLVRALTGVDTDRLPEEKRRGMTIDLGYAYDGDIGFVDVPGHERFVHTMLAGAGGIDAALLVVAADDGVMPQTIEHVQILDLLGITSAVVALTRVDRAPGRAGEVARQVHALLAETALHDAPVLPVSAVTGEGIADLRATLQSLATRTRDSDGHPRLAIDRAFTIAGAGLVVTGTLLAGRIAVGDRLTLSPAGQQVRVRGLHAQNRAAEEAHAGQRVALNIAGAIREKVQRGDWVLHPEAHAPTAQFDARIRLLPEARPLKGDTAVHLHLAAAHVTARMAPLAGPIAPGAEGFVRLTLERPMGALAMDRIVLRDAGANATIGGGVVLDPWPPRRGRRTPARLRQLAALDQPLAPAFAALLDDGWVDFSPFARARNLTEARRTAILAESRAVLAGGFAVQNEQWEKLHASLSAALAAHHHDHPDFPGLAADKLRAALAVRAPLPLFRALIEAALRRGALVQEGPWLRLPSHTVRLSPQDERVWETARALIAAHRFNPPRTRDMVPALGVAEVQLRASLKRLARLGRVVEVAPDHFFLPEAVAEMAAIAAALERDAGALATAAFRDRLGIGRKVAIQVLEFFDAAGVTRRTGDTRRVAGTSFLPCTNRLMEPELRTSLGLISFLALMTASASAQTAGPWQDCDGLTTHVTVRSDAMVPGLAPGRRVLALCFTHAIQGSSMVAGQVRLELLSPSLRRGDLVAFRRPDDPSQTDIRRVIAFPGDQVQVREYRVLINDTLLSTVYIGPEQLVDTGGHLLPVVRLHETISRGVLGYDVLIPEDSTDAKATSVAERVPARFIFVLPDNRATTAHVAEGGWNMVPVVNLIARIDLPRSR